jgi:hypothetical protein
MKKMYAVRQEKLSELLRLFLFAEEVYQNDLPNMMKISSRSVIRQLEFLQQNGLIEFSRIERPNKKQKGRGKHVWRITFEGILQMIALDNRNMRTIELDKIAETHKNKWLIFQEWPFLARDKKAKELVMLQIEVFAGETFSGKTIFDTTFGGKVKSFATAQGLIETRKWSATLHALWLYGPFMQRALPFSFYEESFSKNKKVSSSEGIPYLWKYILNNSRLRKFVKDEFVRERQVHSLLLDVEKWLFSDQ